MTARITALHFILCGFGHISGFDSYSVPSTLYPYLTPFPSLFDCRLRLRIMLQELKFLKIECEYLYQGHLQSSSWQAPLYYRIDLSISWSLKAFSFATPGIMASSSVYKAPCTWTCLRCVDLVVCLTWALLLWVFTLWIGLFCFAFLVCSFWVLMALILSMLRVSLCCVSVSWVNCDGRRVRASDSGRSRKWPPFVLRGWGREWAGSAPPPQLGECLRIWRVYLLTGRCKIVVRAYSLLPAGEGRIWSPPETTAHAQTIEDLQDWFPG